MGLDTPMPQAKGEMQNFKKLKQFGLIKPTEPIIPGRQVPRLHPMSLLSFLALLLEWYIKPRRSLYCETAVVSPELGSLFPRCQGYMHRRCSITMDAYAHCIWFPRVDIHSIPACPSASLEFLSILWHRDNNGILNLTWWAFRPPPGTEDTHAA